MILFFISTALFAGALLLYRPEPESLKAARISYGQNFFDIKGTLTTGFVLLCIFLFSSDFAFLQIEPHIFKLLTLQKSIQYPGLLLVQIFAHSFLHLDLPHLMTNVLALGFLSAYERRVGTGRYFQVLLICTAGAIPSILVYPDGIRICGISGGVLGLAAAFFTDHNNLRRRDWIFAVLFFALMVTGLTFLDALRGGLIQQSYRIDHVGHALGAITGVVFCRLYPA